MTDPSEWAGHVSAESESCRYDFNVFLQEIVKVYGDMDR
jgi:hypothetical protein